MALPPGRGHVWSQSRPPAAANTPPSPEITPAHVLHAPDPKPGYPGYPGDWSPSEPGPTATRMTGKTGRTGKPGWVARPTGTTGITGRARGGDGGMGSWGGFRMGWQGGHRDTSGTVHKPKIHFGHADWWLCVRAIPKGILHTCTLTLQIVQITQSAQHARFTTHWVSILALAPMFYWTR